MTLEQIRAAEKQVNLEVAFNSHVTKTKGMCRLLWQIQLLGWELHHLEPYIFPIPDACTLKVAAIMANEKILAAPQQP